MWIRKVQVIVTDASNPSNKTTFEKHSIEFEVRSVIGWAADTATVTLYNLSIPEIKFLQNKTFGDLLIEIRAGYADELAAGGITNRTNSTTTKSYNGEARIEIEDGAVLPTIFSGVISNAIGYRRAPEHITTVFCVSKAGVNSTTFKKLNSIKPGSTLRQAIKSMCADYGFNVISSYGVNTVDFDTVLPKGRVFHDTFINEFTKLLGEYNLRFYMATAEVQIFPDVYGDKDAISRMQQGRGTIKIDPNAVIDTPIAGIGIFDISIYLRGDIYPGMVIDISSLLGTDLLANGVVSVSNGQQLLNYDDSVIKYALSSQYMVESVILHGETHGLDFACTIHGVLDGMSSNAFNDRDWQDWYARSGMAQQSRGF